MMKSLNFRHYWNWLRRNFWILLIVFLFFGLLASLGFHYLLDSSKTLWEFLELFLEALIIPLSLALFGFFLQSIQSKKEAEHRNSQQFISEEKSKEEALQIFFDRISSLLIDSELIEISSIPVNELTSGQRMRINSVKAIMLARTSSILRNLPKDAKRKGIVVKFLRASGALSSTSAVSRVDSQAPSKLEINLGNGDMDLSYAYLQNANLAGLELEGVNFSKATLSNSTLTRANLASANLNKANLSQSGLIKTNLKQANLSYANLLYTNLTEADLSHAILHKAVMVGTKLIGANLEAADLSGAQLRGESLIAADQADLRGADLRDANLCEADLIGVDLRDADLTRANLQSIKFNLQEMQEGKYKYPPTQWPSKEKVMQALNIPDALKKHFEI